MVNDPVLDAIEAMQEVVSEALAKAPLDSIEGTIRDAVERSGLTDEFAIEQVEPNNYKVIFRPKVPLRFITLTLPDGVSLTDQEVEQINAEYGGGS